MAKITQINIKNRTYYFYDDVILLLRLLKFVENGANSSKNFGIYYIGYITKKDEYKINSFNPFYLIVREIKKRRE